MADFLLRPPPGYRAAQHGGRAEGGVETVAELLDRGFDDIIVVDDLEDGHKFVNISDLPIADYLDKDEFLERLAEPRFARGLKAVFHQGACSTTTEWDGRYMMQNNYGYSQALLHHCLEHNVQYIYASSAAVYGASETFTEEPLNEKPLNVYGYSKLQFDRYVRRVVAEPSSQVVGLRYFNVYGPREQHKGGMASVAFHFNNQLLADGEGRRREAGSEGSPTRKCGATNRNRIRGKASEALQSRKGQHSDAAPSTRSCRRGGNGVPPARSTSWS